MPFLTIGGAELYAESAGSGELYAESAGSGEPVLLLHGGFCSLESLRPQADALASTHAVHAFERAGHGRSADVPGEYSYERGVADALEYLDAAGIASAHLIGYSDGAIIGLLLALRHPERVRSLVAISANLDPGGFAWSAPEGAVQLQPLDPAPVATDVEGDWYARLSPDGAEHAQVVLDKLFRLWSSEPRIEPASLAAITAPVLVLSGDRDSIRPDHSLLIAGSIPRAQLCILPGSSHGLVNERPGLIATIVGEFLGALG